MIYLSVHIGSHGSTYREEVVRNDFYIEEFLFLLHTDTDFQKL